VACSGGWPKLGAIKLMFYGYAALGLLAAFLPNLDKPLRTPAVGG